MRLFVHEYTCAEESSSNVPADSLQTEGWAMLSALLADLGQLPDVEAWTILRQGTPDSWRNQIIATGGYCQRINQMEAASSFRELARSADYTLVIAPEFAQIHETRSEWVLESGGQLLGSSPAAVTLAGDKLRLSRHLREHDLPTPESQLFDRMKPPEIMAYPLVWKPRWGAGCQATYLVRHAEEWSLRFEQAQAEGWKGETLVQPFMPGLAASVAFLVGPCTRVALLPGAQIISQEGCFHYRGGALPLTQPLADRAVRLADRAIASVAGLRGFVGVDLVLGAADDGSQDWIIEINPRLTTSYLGLRALAQTNLADALLRISQGKKFTNLSWGSGRVKFLTNGKVIRHGLVH
jgi:predicted ATP-grasp superfamily ATP-dependent carboligase